MSHATGVEVYRQLVAADALKHVKGACHVGDHHVTGHTGLLMVIGLRRDTRFSEGWLHGLHADVGDNLTDFRGHRGAFGNGSLQIVVDLKTGQFYADLDLWNPYTDLVNWIGHSGEVVAGWLRPKPREHT